MIKSSSYLRLLKNEISELSKKHGFDENWFVENIIDDHFLTLKEFIEDPRMPIIKITNLGTFRPKLNRINWKIRMILKAVHEKRYSREEGLKKITKIWKVRNRLIAENNNINTWSKWKKRGE